MFMAFEKNVHNSTLHKNMYHSSFLIQALWNTLFQLYARNLFHKLAWEHRNTEDSDIFLSSSTLYA